MAEVTDRPPRAGRPRTPGVDEAVLRVTLRRLAEDGYAGMSMAKIAADAGTTLLAELHAQQVRRDTEQPGPGASSLTVIAVALLQRDQERLAEQVTGTVDTDPPDQVSVQDRGVLVEQTPESLLEITAGQVRPITTAYRS